MAMVNLKSDPKEKESSTLCCPEMDEPAYPYGLTVQLCDETMQKLGMAELPKVGSVITFQARAVVVSVSQYEEAQPDPEDGSKQERSASLQITDMDLGAPAGTSIEQRLYKA